MSSPDPRAVEADDRLLDALAAGELTGPDLTDDPAIAALADWRAELATATSPAGTAPARVRRRRPARSPRRSLAAAAATAAVLVGGGVAAAAVSGPHGPLGGLHRLVFGAGDHAEHSGPGQVHVDAADRSAHLLDRAARLLRKTPRSLQPSDRHAIAVALDRAHRLIVSDPHLDASRAARLDARLDRLRTRLASLPASTTGTASSPSAVPSPGTGTAVTRQAPGAGRSDGPTPGPSGTEHGSGHPHRRITDTPLPTPSTPSTTSLPSTTVPTSSLSAATHAHTPSVPHQGGGPATHVTPPGHAKTHLPRLLPEEHRSSHPHGDADGHAHGHLHPHPGGAHGHAAGLLGKKLRRQ